MTAPLNVEPNNLYTYAFLKTPDASIDLPHGISDRSILISNAGVSALIEPGISIESIKKDDEKLIKAVLSHDRVICEVFRQTTLLPLRFGTCFASQPSLLEHLQSHAKEYLQKLAQLAEKSEHILKLLPIPMEESTITPEAGGRQYFLAKKQRYQIQQDYQALQTAEWENVTKLITETYESAIVSQAEGEEARIYLLVDRQNESLLSEQFLAWQKVCPRWELQLGEALPPYHFT